MVTNGSAPSKTKLEQKLKSFADYLCARRGLTECTIAGYVSAIRRLSPTVGLNPDHHALDSLIVVMRSSGASYSHVVNTSLALERLHRIHWPSDSSRAPRRNRSDSFAARSARPKSPS